MAAEGPGSSKDLSLSLSLPESMARRMGIKGATRPHVAADRLGEMKLQKLEHTQLHCKCRRLFYKA